MIDDEDDDDDDENVIVVHLHFLVWLCVHSVRSNTYYCKACVFEGNGITG